VGLVHERMLLLGSDAIRGESPGLLTYET